MSHAAGTRAEKGGRAYWIWPEVGPGGLVEPSGGVVKRTIVQEMDSWF